MTACKHGTHIWVFCPQCNAEAIAREPARDKIEQLTEADVRRIVREELAKQPLPIQLQTIGAKR